MHIGKFIARGTRFLQNRIAPRGALLSFAYGGEDLIMAEALKKWNVSRATYIDIGAHHPIFSNNTYLFYKNKGHGVIVEPHQNLCDLAQRKRSRDTTLCAGAGRANGQADFFVFPQSTRSTFSKDQAEEWVKQSGQSFSVVSLPLLSLDTIIAKHCGGTAPDVISIDAEGYDIEILSGFSWNTRPKVFCVESLVPSSSPNTPTRRKDVYELFAAHQYFPYAETSANTIFVDTIAWND